MHRLSRQIRFSVNPFLDETETGSNSYASKPSGQGLAIYFALWVELAATVDPDTGFVVNVVEIDKAVRRTSVGVISDFIKERYSQRQNISLADIYSLLREIAPAISDKFGDAKLISITLELNPFRKITIEMENNMKASFSEKFEFAAMHKLWNDSFSEDKNFDIFGKCANPSGHGHNYVIEVTVEKQNPDELFSIGTLEKTVSNEFIDLVDHKNLNVDVDYFSTTIPTVENIAVFAWERLNEKIADARLSSVTVWESDRTCCTYSG